MRLLKRGIVEQYGLDSPGTSFPPLFHFLFLQSSDPLVCLTSQGPMRGASRTLQDTPECSSF